MDSRRTMYRTSVLHDTYDEVVTLLTQRAVNPLLQQVGQAWPGFRVVRRSLQVFCMGIMSDHDLCPRQELLAQVTSLLVYIGGIGEGALISALTPKASRKAKRHEPVAMEANPLLQLLVESSRSLQRYTDLPLRVWTDLCCRCSHAHGHPWMRVLSDHLHTGFEEQYPATRRWYARRQIVLLRGLRRQGRAQPLALSLQGSAALASR